MQNKLSFEHLLDWVEGRLSAAETEQIAAIVAADATLQEEAAWLHTFRQTATQTRWAEPPAETLKALNRQFAERAAQNRPPSVWERLVATLKFDSQTQPLPTGLRATALSPERQLMYQTALADVALTIQLPTAHKKYTVLGQILMANSPVSEVFSVQLVQNGAEKAFVVSDEGGEFVFEEVQGGEYEMLIHNDQHEFVILVKISV